MNDYEGLDLTPEELELIKRAESSQANAAGIGTAAGTALGGLAGGLIGGIPTGGAGAIPGAGLGASIGGSLGGWLGSLIGGKDAEAASAELDKLMKARQEETNSKLAANSAINQLLGAWLPGGRQGL